MFYWSKMGRSRLSFMLNSVTQPQNCTTEFLKCVCECVYMCACGCAYVWDGLCVCTWLWRPRDNLEHHPQEHYPPPLETPFLSSMAWRSPMRLRCLARVSQGSTSPGCTMSGIFEGVGRALGTEFRSSWLYSKLFANRVISPALRTHKF